MSHAPAVSVGVLHGSFKNERSSRPPIDEFQNPDIDERQATRNIWIVGRQLTIGRTI